MLETTVVVIGGGATGMGTLRDLAMRGVPAILLEQGGLAQAHVFTAFCIAARAMRSMTLLPQRNALRKT